MTNLTPRQIEVVNAIRDYRQLHGFAPTMQELGDILGISKVSVFEHVGLLERKRVLRRDKHKARSLEVIEDAGALEIKLRQENKRLHLLLEQHDSYDLGDGLSLGRRQSGRWVIYFNGLHLDGHLNVEAPLRLFSSTQAALRYIDSPSGAADVAAVRAKTPAMARV